MGLFDGMLGNLAGSLLGSSGGVNTAQPSNNPLVQIAMQMLSHQASAQSTGTDSVGGNSAKASMGGLSGILDAFQRNGLGHLADSWVATGENLPVNGEQLSQVLGSDKLSAMASQFGISPAEISGGLAKILPQLINHVTPNGQVPADHSMIQDALSMLLKR